jgi:hypothetical protein
MTSGSRGFSTEVPLWKCWVAGLKQLWLVEVVWVAFPSASSSPRCMYDCDWFSINEFLCSRRRWQWRPAHSNALIDAAAQLDIRRSGSPGGLSSLARSRSQWHYLHLNSHEHAWIAPSIAVTPSAGFRFDERDAASQDEMRRDETLLYRLISS